jgi:hypothetical protein
LKLLGRPELAKLVQETRDADNKAESTVTSAPALTKTAYRCGASQSMVFNWATKMVEAIVRHQQYRYDEVAGERTLKQWFDLLVAEDGSILPKNGRIHDFIVRAIEMSMKLKDEKVTELSYVIEALQRTSCEQADIKAMLRFWFGLMVKDQEMFRMEVERIRSIRKMPENSYSVLALCDGRDIRLNLLVLDGADSPHAHRAAMYNDRESGRSPADIVIVRNSSGNVQIYTHKGRCHGVSLDNLWKAIRWLEMPADKRSKISPDQLDNVVDSDRWYYFKLGGAIFNGSLTNEREATCVPRRAMIEAIQFCLHPQGCGKFMELYQPRSIRFNAPRPQKDNGRGNQGRRPADLKDLEKALDRGVPHEGPASKPVALARVA